MESGALVLNIPLPSGYNEGAWYLNMAFRLRLSQLGSMRSPPEVAGARAGGFSFVIGYYIEYYIEANVLLTFFLVGT